MIAQNVFSNNTETYSSPQCPQEGQTCDDGDANTINDVLDANCNCVGVVPIAQTCDDVQIAYQINDGARVNNATTVTVGEGENITLFSNLDLSNYTIKNSQGITVDNNVISNISIAQAGVYTLETTLGKTLKGQGELSISGYSSQEIQNADEGAAVYAIDDNNGTRWHTQYSQENLSTPHYIELDLGAVFNVSGFQYRRRTDQYPNGIIEKYQIYVSNTTPVTTSPENLIASGDWGQSTSSAPGDVERVADFNGSIKSGRYVRLVATETYSDTGASYATAAELRVVIQCTKTIQIDVDPKETYTYTDDTWSPESPIDIATSNDTVTIASGDLVLADNLSIDNLTVAPGASLTIASGATLSAKTTTLQSNSMTYSSLILNGNIEGTVKYERYTNAIGTSTGGGNDLISAPLANIEFGPFATENESILAPSGDIRAFAPYNTAEAAYQNYDVRATANEATVLTSGEGYRAATIDGSNLIFTGDVPTGEVTIAITDAAAGFAWNLIGNPYPSYLDFESFFEVNKSALRSDGAFQAIYGYTGNSGEWTTWNSATILDNNINSSITPGQGFFVKSKVGGANVSFTLAMRTTGSSDDFILGRASNSNFASTKLYLNSEAKERSTQIYFIEGTTRGLDAGYDAGSFMDSAAEFSIFSNLVEDNTGLDLSIQSLPYEDLTGVIVPLGVNAPAAVELTIGISDMSSYPENTTIYLEDRLENTFTLLNETEYVFTPTLNLNGTGRFYLHYSNTTLGVGQNDLDILQIYAESNPKRLHVNGQLKASTKVNLYDTQGRLVLSSVLNDRDVQNTIDISMIGTGVYIVKVFNGMQSKTQKLII
ncbi:putative secreted protein (Por secretion system target) [Winogradskyella epiphytica]|uniref:Putative secreted protein (Por secretion system target) n=1 Tax=Winogradskyella epiphytica TaxID=262005 RepID=A0A2V4XQ09_9FLAO|nr:discoidin domain-containing protein [Winogradskyella epiphytica]PYE79612.1 putative secreted protein (Por secretion system target) [Winogradskyella epiphytica]GGW73970.1 hypothetical protein GCM10008085_27670 [Winogradskyella epiphytica]